MKKLLTLLLILLLMLGLGACNSNESNNSITNQDAQEQTTAQEETKQDEVEDVQQEEVVVEEDTKEEIKEETTKEIDPEVLKTYDYWVVFFDHDGNELQREAIKWGTTPTYWSDIPYYSDGEHWYKFTGWKDRYGRDVKEFKPITGNTRFYAQYEIGGSVYSGGGGEPTPPAPDPEYIQVECLTSSGGANGSYIDTKVAGSTNIQFIFDIKMNKVVTNRPVGNFADYGYGTVGCIGFLSYANGLNVYGGTSWGQYESNSPFGAKVTMDYSINTTYALLKLNGTTVKQQNMNGFAQSHTPNTNIYVFTFNGQQGLADNQPISIYNMKIYQSGSLVRDYIAVKTIKEIDMSKNATDPTTNIPVDTLCFYDQLNDLYYLNSGTTPFTDVPIS